MSVKRDRGGYMTTSESITEAVNVLQQLGLREYEAECFVGLTRLSRGTAKEISEVTEVPRTRVYDSVRVLEAQGLVVTQHTSPKRFQTVPIEEVIQTFRDQYERNLDRLADALEAVTDVERESREMTHEVGTISGRDAITDRAERLITDATSEVVLIIGEQSLFTTECIESLSDVDDEVTLFVGTANESLQTRIENAVPRAETFVSGAEWLEDERGVEDDRAIGRLLMIDRSAILVSTVTRSTDDEHAMFGVGSENGLVIVARRLLAQGTLPVRDPDQE
ncbi:TrmB family transcriptional regulator [Halopenitus sp. H-Gu1]|uniref:TrmB family transcriptional regulator n=1 Tax=Halopenitus sp. H-Gu1 TaxID=3242697 RepID=UPI00359E64C5